MVVLSCLVHFHLGNRPYEVTSAPFRMTLCDNITKGRHKDGQSENAAVFLLRGFPKLAISVL